MTAEPVKPPADSERREPSLRAIQRWENEGGAVERPSGAPDSPRAPGLALSPRALVE